MHHHLLLPPEGKGARIAFRDGAYLLIDPPICHGYQNACVCTDCRARADLAETPRQQLAQPWEPRRAA